MVSIGPDAHSPAGFENLELGVAVARKGWLGAGNVLNTRPVDEVLAFAHARRLAPRVAPAATSAAPRLRVI